jgi:hypothetical protein
MSWKNRYNVIKVGDTVRCIEGNFSYFCGFGWKPDRTFVVGAIYTYEPEGHPKLKCYMPLKECQGVFEGFVEKVEE